MAEATPTSPHVKPLLDEKQRLDRRILDLEEEIQELRAPIAELEAALERKAKATCNTRGGGQRGGRPAAVGLPESGSSCFCR
jgi:predicted  nucleic acid-binding Zn-ribbon protein